MYATCFVSLEDFHNVFDWTSIVYALVFCVVALVFSRQIRIAMLYYVATPIIIAGTLLALFHGSPTHLPSMLSNIGFFTYLVFVLVLYCALCREQNSEPLRASCLLILSLYAGLLAGRQLFSLVDAHIGMADPIVIHAPIEIGIVIVMVVCTMIGMRITSRIVSDELSQPQFTHITAVETSEFSARLATVFKLSEREREVLSLLLENKSASEIAAAMTIAHGTAKTHINNIYKKLNIHTREELFAMIPGRPE